MAIISQKIIKNTERPECTILPKDNYGITKFGIVVNQEMLTKKENNNLYFIVSDFENNEEIFYMNDIGIFEIDEIFIKEIKIGNITNEMIIIVDYIMEEK